MEGAEASTCNVSTSNQEDTEVDVPDSTNYKEQPTEMDGEGSAGCSSKKKKKKKKKSNTAAVDDCEGTRAYYFEVL